MYRALFVIYTLASIVSASVTPILVSECGILDAPHATYKLMHDIAIGDQHTGSVCFNIKGNGITLDGNGFELSSASRTLLQITGVKYDGDSATVTGMRITNLRTGVHANGMFGEVNNNTISSAINGIDVTATNNKISNNKICNFMAADESTSGIYIYFPPVTPVDSFINVTNNIISDIRGDNFVTGISVYYAKSVHIANNQIINLSGEYTDSISVIYGSAEKYNNTFIQQEGNMPSTSTLLLSFITLLVSVYFLRASKNSSVLAAGESVKELENKMKKSEDDEGEFEMDGADMVRIKSKLSVSIGASPGFGSSPIGSSPGLSSSPGITYSPEQ